MNSNFTISLEKNKLDITKIHAYISKQSYWGKGRTLEQVRTSIDKSVCFGAYIDNQQVAFARVVSDTIAFAYLLDVIVFEEYQGNGFSKLLMNAILEHHEFKTVSWLLRTSDAQGLYEKFGFSTIDSPMNYLTKPAIENS